MRLKIPNLSSPPYLTTLLLACFTPSFSGSGHFSTNYHVHQPPVPKFEVVSYSANSIVVHMVNAEAVARLEMKITIYDLDRLREFRRSEFTAAHYKDQVGRITQWLAGRRGRKHDLKLPRREEHVRQCQASNRANQQQAEAFVTCAISVHLGVSLFVGSQVPTTAAGESKTIAD